MTLLHPIRSRTVIALWFENDMPARLVHDGARYRVTDHPTRLDSKTRTPTSPTDSASPDGASKAPTTTTQPHVRHPSRQRRLAAHPDLRLEALVADWHPVQMLKPAEWLFSEGRGMPPIASARAHPRSAVAARGLVSGCNLLVGISWS